MADVLNDTELRKSIAEIVKNGDLATLTSRQVREILEKKYDVNLMNRKKQIDDIVMQIIDEESDDSDDNASAESPNKSDSVKKSSKEESSEEETEIQSRVSAKVVNKKEKKKSKEESDSNEQESDDDDDDDDESYEDPPKLKKKRPAVKNKEKSKDAKKPKTEKGGAKKKTGFAKPMLLSPKLAALMGETHMARSDIVKKMWQIIRERNLLDPSNKRYTICDDELKEIFGHKRFMTFAMMKFLKKHIKDPALM